MAGAKWSDLSPRTQRLIIIGAAVETSLKAAALVDLKRRPAGEIRGSKWMWVPALTVVNSAGMAPLAEGFIDHYIAGVLYPANYVMLVEAVVFAVVVTSWILVARAGRRRSVQL